MRPGYLGDLEDFWFGNFGDDYFEILEANSAFPLYVIRDRISGRTAEEFKALDFEPGWASLNIAKQQMSDKYQNNPYRESNSNWQQLVDDARIKSQIFR